MDDCNRDSHKVKRKQKVSMELQRNSSVFTARLQAVAEPRPAGELGTMNGSTCSVQVRVLAIVIVGWIVSRLSARLRDQGQGNCPRG